MAATTSAAVMQVASLSTAASSKAVTVGFNATQTRPISLSCRRLSSPVYRRLSVSCEASAGPRASPEVLSQVRDVIAKQLAQEVDKIAPDAKFADIGADSLDTVEIMMALEEQFEITLGEENSEKISTVQDAADLIHSIVEEGKK